MRRYAEKRRRPGRRDNMHGHKEERGK
jgi:hypothetical protein